MAMGAGRGYDRERARLRPEASLGRDGSGRPAGGVPPSSAAVRAAYSSPVPAAAPSTARDPRPRGLSATAAVVLAAVPGLFGAVVDLATGDGLRTLFGVLLVVGCALAVLLVRVDELATALVATPLVYAVAAVIAGTVGASQSVASSWLKQELLEIFTALVINGRVLLVAAVVVGVLALLRRYAAGRRQSRPAPRPTAGAPLR